MPNVALVDVHQVDGEVWEVAGVAGEQFKATIELSLLAIDGLEWAARGSWLTQEHHRTGTMPDADDWKASHLHRKIAAQRDALHAALKQAEMLRRTVAWDPRSV